MIRSVLILFLLGLTPFSYGQANCSKLLSEIKAALEQNSNSSRLIRQYQKSCYPEVCEVLCEFDALNLKYLRSVGEYKSALVYGKKALNKAGNEKFKAQILVEMAIVHYIREDMANAVKCLHRAISIKSIEKDIEAKAFLMLGNAHRFLGNTNYAIRYFSKTYKVALRIADSSLVPSALNGQGLIAYGKGKPNDMKRAIRLYQKSLIFTGKNELVQSLNIKNNIAAAYSNLKEYDKSEKYFKECARIFTLLGDFEGVAFTYNNIAAIFIETKQWEKAKAYLTKAMLLYDDELYGQQIIPEMNLSLSDLYYHEGKYQLSRDYYAKYAQSELKRLNAEQSESVIKSQERYDDLKRTKLINDLKLSKKRAEVRNLRLQNAIFIILVAFLLLSSIVYFIVNALRRREKRERKAALNRAALQSAENEKLRVSRELHDSMGGMLTVMNLLLGHEAEKDPTNENLSLLSETTKTAIADLRRICRDLYPSELKISGLNASLNSYFEKLNHSQDGVRFVLEAAEDLNLDGGFSINFYRIAQELTNNTLKYANASEARLKFFMAEDKFYAHYHDNGQGIDTKRLRKGVGLNSIEERTFSFNGKVEFKSAANEGFDVKLTFSKEQTAASAINSL